MALSREEMLQIKKQFQEPSKTTSLSRSELLALKNQFSPPKTAYESATPSMGMEGGASLAAGQGLWDAAGKAIAGLGKLASYLPDKFMGTKMGEAIPTNLAPSPSISTQQAIQQNPGLRGVGEGMGDVAMLSSPWGIESLVGKGLGATGFLGKTIPQVVGRGTEFGTQAAALNPDDVPEAFAIGSVLGIASKPLEKLINIPKLIKEKSGAQATSEEARRNLEAFQQTGARPQLGKVVKSPTIGSLQSSMAYLPGSGQAPANMAVGNAIKGKVNGVLDQLKPQEGVNVSKNVVGQLKQRTSAAEREKEAIYSQLEELADTAKDPIEMGSTSAYAGKRLKAITKYSHENRATSAILKDSDLYPILEEAANTPKKSFGAALQLDRQLEQLAQEELKSNGKTLKYNSYRMLQRNINNDLKQGAIKQRRTDIIDLQDQADILFKENILPLRAKEIRKFTEKGARPEKLIPSALKSGHFEQPELLKTFTDHMTPEQKSNFAYEYLTKGARTIKNTKDIKEGKVLEVYGKMGDEVKRELLTPAQRAVLDNAYVTKKLMNTDLDQMINPKTGASLSKLQGAAGIAISPATSLLRRLLSNPRMIELLIRQMEKTEGKRASPVVSGIQGAIKPSFRFSPALSAWMTQSSGKK